MRYGHTAREYHNYPRDIRDISGTRAISGTRVSGCTARVKSVLRPEHPPLPGATVRQNQEL